MIKVKFINILLLFFVFVVSEGLISQTTTFLEKKDFKYNDSTVTPVINIGTGAIVNSKDIKKQNVNPNLSNEQKFINQENSNLILIDPKMIITPK